MNSHGAALSYRELRRGLVCALKLAALIAFSSAQGQSEEDCHSSVKVSNIVSSKNGRVAVEMLRMMNEKGEPEANVVGVYARDLKTGKTHGLPMADGGLETAALSEDGRYIVLEYHISSGGDAKGFVRMKNGEYREFIENGYAAEQVRAGKVKGIQETDFPNTHGRNMYHGLGLAHSPDRLVFALHSRFLIDYSLEKRRITGWQRSILNCEWWGKGRQAIRLDEMSDQRGIGLFLCISRRDGWDMYERLVTFPAPDKALRPAESVGDIRLRSGAEEFVELTAKHIAPPTLEDDGTWRVEISGKGAKYEGLKRRFAAEWKEHEKLPGDRKAVWPAPMQFLATPE